MPMGIPRTSTIMKSDWDRVLKYRKVLKNGCWEWTGCRDAGGSKVQVSLGRGRMCNLQKLVYCLHKGMEEPIARPVISTCGNDFCFNPKHLQVISESRAKKILQAKKSRPNNTGSNNGMAKLDERKAMEMRAMKERGATNKEIGQAFGIHPGYAGVVVRRGAWKTAEFGKTRQRKAVVRGPRQAGESHYRAKLTAADVVSIRVRHAEGKHQRKSTRITKKSLDGEQSMISVSEELGRACWFRPRHENRYGVRSSMSLPRRNAQSSGSRHYKATMTEEQVLEGIRRCKAGETIVAVALDLGVKVDNLGDAVRGRTWKHLQ